MYVAGIYTVHSARRETYKFANEFLQLLRVLAVEEGPTPTRVEVLSQNEAVFEHFWDLVLFVLKRELDAGLLGFSGVQDLLLGCVQHLVHFSF